MASWHEIAKCVTTTHLITNKPQPGKFQQEIQPIILFAANWKSFATVKLALLTQFFPSLPEAICTGISSEIRTKLRDWAVGKAQASCYSQAALSSNDSKTEKMACTWFGEVCSCCSQTSLPGPAWVVLITFCKQFFRALYFKFLIYCRDTLCLEQSDLTLRLGHN